MDWHLSFSDYFKKILHHKETHYDIHTKPIYILQKKVVRAITFNNFAAPSTPIFSELKILKLYDLFYLKLLSFVYECVK